jgi:para-aminobenzoate synthetase component I
MSLPCVKEITYQEPSVMFSRFKNWGNALFLDSALLMEACGQYSFIAVDPFQMISSKNGWVSTNQETLLAHPFEYIAREMTKFKQQNLNYLPPFQGGIAGYFGYELAQHLENVPLAARDDMQFADLMIGFYDLVISFDQVEKRAWIISTGFPEAGIKQQQRAEERLQWLSQQLSNEVTTSLLHDMANFNTHTDINATEYQNKVQKIIDYILAGDVFEANLSRRFQGQLPEDCDPFDIYRQLRGCNPAPFAAYLNFKDTILASASPERFVKLSQGDVEARPIKGTCPRGKTEDEDILLAQALIRSQKDRAENIMIVDLMRNDLSKVCRDYSVSVPQLCGLESYATVHHLVSVVTGKLQENRAAMDLLQAVFPGGSVTGAPKLRAMEIIAELEPTQRGPYCGSIGYIGFDGTMDTSITIRTFSIKDRIITFQTGGAVVADSSPLEEHNETLTKAAALFQALGVQYDPAD